MNEPLMRRAIEGFLAEDLGRGDITSTAVVAEDSWATGRFVCKDQGVLAGLPAARMVFALLDGAVEFTPLLAEGAPLRPGQALATVRGPARAILAGERLALNLLQRASGVASLAAQAVAAVQGHKAKILDTRKTTPGLRWLEKYAAKVGGAVNHRFGLDDAVLIKDNHLALAGGVGPALALAKAAVGPMVVIEVEVESLEQLAQAIAAGAGVIMLDNMPAALMAQAVKLCAGRAVLEASGQMDLARLAEVAATGVDYISMGWLTSGAKPLDIGLDLAPAPSGGPARS